MSNRLLAVLILIWIAGAGYLFYVLKYIPNKQAEIQTEIQIQEAEKQALKEPKLIKQIVDEVKITNAEKIEELKESNNNYRTFKLDNTSTAYFLQNENTLDLFYNKKLIGNFNFVYPQYLRVEKISWSVNDLFIEVWTEKFYYNNKANLTQKIELNIDVNYVKAWPENKLIFVTNKWSFVYSIFNKTLDYFSYFNDFIYFNDWYIWLVSKDDKRILNNLWFTTKNENLIVYYNPNTKEKKIVLKTELDIKKIYLYNNKVYLVTDDWELFELENL